MEELDLTVQKNWEDFLQRKSFEEVVKITVGVIKQFNKVLRENQILKEHLSQPGEDSLVDKNNNTEDDKLRSDNVPDNRSDVYNIQVPVIMGNVDTGEISSQPSTVSLVADLDQAIRMTEEGSFETVLQDTLVEG